MIQLSRKLLIFALSVEKDWQHRIQRIRVLQCSATKETLSKRNRRKNLQTLQTKKDKKAHTLCM